MKSRFQESRSGSNDSSASRHVQAWFGIVAVLAAHVFDEAATGFLEFYNPLVLSIRARVQWFPMPTFAFDIWLVGLVGLVLALTSMGRMVRNGSAGAQVASWALAAIMLLNGLGHLGGSLYFHRWLPGTTTAPFLVAASCWLGLRTWERGRQRVTSGQRHAV